MQKIEHNKVEIEDFIARQMHAMPEHEGMPARRSYGSPDLGLAYHPALVIAYQKKSPVNWQHAIEYWAPKADWLVTRAEIIAITPEDRCTLSLGQVLHDLEGKDAPQMGSNGVGLRLGIGDWLTGYHSTLVYAITSACEGE